MTGGRVRDTLGAEPAATLARRNARRAGARRRALLAMAAVWGVAGACLATTAEETRTLAATRTATCAPTATPYCADRCEPCPTIRAGCPAQTCGECHENPSCADAEVCVGYGPGLGTCCSCATVTVAPHSPTPTPTPPIDASPTANAPRCDGDCDGDGAIGIDELVAAVNEALAGAQPQGCESFDRDDDGAVAIDELIALVRDALIGCTPVDFSGVARV
jgi:hypothetical protein